MLKLYYTDIKNFEERDYNNELSEYRKEKLNKQKSALSRRQSIAAELLLNSAVRENFPVARFPLNIITRYNKKPYCPELPFYFNLSHCENLVICAVSNKDLGADIQLIGEYKKKLAERQFRKEETDYIEASQNKALAFTRIWARKESCLKALGTGLQLSMKSFSVLPGERCNINNKSFNIIEGCIKDYCFAVCLPGDKEEIPEIIEIKL